jgi:hypothetical protein
VRVSQDLFPAQAKNKEVLLVYLRALKCIDGTAMGLSEKTSCS